MESHVVCGIQKWGNGCNTGQLQDKEKPSAIDYLQNVEATALDQV
jgi:hypothetical protein